MLSQVFGLVGFKMETRLVGVHSSAGFCRVRMSRKRLGGKYICYHGDKVSNLKIED